jgi:PepSY-associated TM region
MRFLTVLHRWLGILVCLLFAMWFASGIVMHFVPFPALSEADRIAGLAPLETARVLHGPAEAARADGHKDVTRVRLLQRSDGPVYLTSGPSGVAAFRADNLAAARIGSRDLAVAIAMDHARRRGMDVTPAAFTDLVEFDQWTVAGDLNRYRPLYRVALNDEPGTELYVSSATGEVVRDTTRFERRWNYIGSVAHWIYPVVLRSRPAAWSATVWSLSLVALVAATAGSLLGLLRVKVIRYRLSSPYSGWHGWHHGFGLLCMIFVLSWIFSGWLSMDSGWLFSTGEPTREEKAIISGTPAWDRLLASEKWPVSAHAKEIEWFAFDRKFYRRERTGVATQLLFPDAGTDVTQPTQEFLSPREMGSLAERFARGCKPPFVVPADDIYAISSAVPGAPVYRSVCGDVWLDIDGANGALLERSDPSRRAYRWLYRALHTLDMPALTSRPALRGALIVSLCGLGLIFSLTGIVIGWRRLTARQPLSRPTPASAAP